jgi:hypothetical protein
VFAFKVGVSLNFRAIFCRLNVTLITRNRNMSGTPRICFGDRQFDKFGKLVLQEDLFIPKDHYDFLVLAVPNLLSSNRWNVLEV